LYFLGTAQCLDAAGQIHPTGPSLKLQQERSWLRYLEPAICIVLDRN